MVLSRRRPQRLVQTAVMLTDTCHSRPSIQQLLVGVVPMRLELIGFLHTDFGCWVHADVAIPGTFECGEVYSIIYKVAVPL